MQLKISVGTLHENCLQCSTVYDMTADKYRSYMSKTGDPVLQTSSKSSKKNLTLQMKINCITRILVPNHYNI